MVYLSWLPCNSHLHVGMVDSPCEDIWLCRQYTCFAHMVLSARSVERFQGCAAWPPWVFTKVVGQVDTASWCVEQICIHASCTCVQWLHVRMTSVFLMMPETLAQPLQNIYQQNCDMWHEIILQSCLPYCLLDWCPCYQCQCWMWHCLASILLMSSMQSLPVAVVWSAVGVHLGSKRNFTAKCCYTRGLLIMELPVGFLAMVVLWLSWSFVWRSGHLLLCWWCGVFVCCSEVPLYCIKTKFWLCVHCTPASCIYIQCV